MSSQPKVERKLAAIMFTDIAGYTESMSYDENEAITAVKKNVLSFDRICVTHFTY